VFDDGDLTRDLRRAIDELSALERTVIELKAEIQHREAALRAQGNF
jgi:multidrug resistance efflux pump